MDLHEALLGRRTVHDYAPEPVPDAVIHRALAAAHQAPCHRFTWPWRFTWVGPEARAEITRLGVALKAAKGPLSERQQQVAEARLANPGALLIVTQRLAADAATREEDYAAIACAIQNLQLAVWADGYGAKWSTGGIRPHPQVAALIGLDAAAEAVVGFVWVGVPARVPSPVVRPPIDGFVRQIP